MRIVTQIKEKFLSLSLTKKMFVLFALAGLIPLSVEFVVSYNEISKYSLSNRKYMTEQAYQQTLTALSDEFKRIHKLSTLIIGNQNFNSSLKIIKRSKNFSKQYAEYKELNNNLSNLYFSTEYDSILYHVNSDFNVNESMFPLFRSSDTKEGEKCKKELEHSNGNPVWLQYNDTHTYNSGKYLSLCRYVPDTSNYEKNIGILMVNINIEKIKNMFICTVPEELIYIRREGGQVVAANSSSLLKVLHITPGVEKNFTNRFNYISINNNSFIACSKRIPNTNLRLVSVMPANVINKSIIYNDSKIVILYCCICIIMLIIIFTIAKSISKRIILLSHKMKGVKKGNLEKLDIKQNNDEVGNLINNYNYMVDEIKSLLVHQFELGQEKKEAELKALQSQINPHFLYNTLDMINWMAQKNETENIREIVYSLSQYYRLILNKGEDITTIGEELQLCNAYISIQQKRFKDRIKFEVEVEENVMMYLIPKITLQPLIENAIVHGISESSRGRGNIIISGWEDGDNIVLAVTDDGVGIDKNEEISNDHKGSGYGIRNIEMRLTLFYGIPHCISYDSTKGVGTCVSLNIRKIKADSF